MEPQRPFDAAQHWRATYRRNGPEAVSWYQDQPAMSLRLLAAAGISPDRSVLDVGGGASTLVDHLVDQGLTDVTVLDIAIDAMAASRDRLGPRAAQVHWLEQDLLTWNPGRRYDVWHDRAVFHFLTQDADRDRYRRALDAAVTDDGQIIIATFAADGPEYCSGLPVARYSPDELAAQFPAFQVAQTEQEHHHTPAGATQSFTWLRLLRG